MASLSKHVSQLYGLALYTINNSQQYIIQLQTTQYIPFNFVDRATGVHTQAIESYWAKAKYKFKVMKGASTESLPSCLDERMWRDRWGTSTEDALNNLCKCIAEQYPVV